VCAQSLAYGYRLLGKLALVRPYRNHVRLYASHEILSKRWIVDRATLNQARAEDLLYVNDPEHLDFLAIYFANGTLQNKIYYFQIT
jgi:hypothetical protein